MFNKSVPFLFFPFPTSIMRDANLDTEQKPESDTNTVL